MICQPATAIIRLAPVPMFYARHPREGMDRSGETSKTTHGTVVCIDACRYFGGPLKKRNRITGPLSN